MVEELDNLYSAHWLTDCFESNFSFEEEHVIHYVIWHDSVSWHCTVLLMMAVKINFQFLKYNCKISPARPT
jgi:hypothetical protein